MHSTLIENKGLIQAGTMTNTQRSCTLNTYMLQIQTIEGQCTQAYVEHKAIQWYCPWVLLLHFLSGPGCFHTKCYCRGRPSDPQTGPASSVGNAVHMQQHFLQLVSQMWSLWLLLNAHQPVLVPPIKNGFLVKNERVDYTIILKKYGNRCMFSCTFSIL